MIEQGTDAWHQQRLGKITSSRVADIMAKTKSGPAASRKKYMAQLLCERLTGQVEETFTSAAMQRGIDLEPLSRAAYELETGRAVTESGFIIHPEHDWTGTSPDGLVWESGMVEFKNPNTATHIATLQRGTADPKYYWQQQHQLWVAGREWNDFCSYDDRLPDGLAIFIDRVERNEEDIAEMVKEITAFNDELDALETEMRSRM